MQESFDVSNAAAWANGPQPQLISNCTLCCLVVEEQLVLGKVPPSEAALALLGAYYIFNIEYPKGLQNLGTFLEIVLLDKVPRKVPPKVSNLLLSLKTIQ